MEKESIQKEIRGMFQAEGFDCSVQASNHIYLLRDYKSIVKKMIYELKKRKFIIGGGDVQRFIHTGTFSTSPVGETGSNENIKRLG